MMQIVSNVEVRGHLALAKDAADFPSNPKPGTLALVNGLIYAYMTVGGFLTWYPTTHATRSYLHTQGADSTVWNVVHNLNADHLLVQVQDMSGNMMSVERLVVDSNSFQLLFTEACVGTCLVIAPDSMSVPEIQASILKTGSVNVGNGTVTMASDGIKVNGSQVLTVADLGSGSLYITPQQMDDRFAALIGTAPAALDTLGEIGDKLANNDDAVAALVAAVALKANTSALAPVAFSGSYLDLTNRPNIPVALSGFTNDLNYQTGAQVAASITAAAYALPMASATVMGGIKIGSGLNIDAQGVVTAQQYALPTATQTVLGGVKVDGSTIAINSGVISATGALTADYAVKSLTAAGDLLPTVTSAQNIGSPTQRWKRIYVDEAMLSINTLYLGDTPVIGTNQNTVEVKADVDQSILIKTAGLGTSNITSQHGISAITTGTNADVVLQATGTGSKVRLTADSSVELTGTALTLTAPTVTTSGNHSVTGNLTVTGNVTVNGSTFQVNSTTVTTKDNIIVLNNGEVGSGVTAGMAGIQIDRGDLTDFQLIFDETDDSFKMGPVGSLVVMATQPMVAAAISAAAYSLPVASTSTLGGVKVDGSTITINSGVISATVPVTSVFGRTGAVVLGSSDVTTALGFTPYNATNPSGYQTAAQVSSAISAAAYSLPTATTTVLGGVKVDGSTITINSGVISAVGGAGNISGAGTPLSVSSTDSTAAKIALKDAGVLRGSIGATSTNSLQVWNGSGTSMLVVDTSGNVTAVANVTAYSDERLKKDWADLDASGDFISNLASVKCGTYSRIDGDVRQVGVSAQSLQLVMPEAVLADAEGMLSVAYGNAALAAVIELSKTVLKLQARIEELEAK